MKALNHKALCSRGNTLAGFIYHQGVDNSFCVLPIMRHSSKPKAYCNTCWIVIMLQKNIAREALSMR